MTAAIQQISAAFPDYLVSANRRPDDSYLLVLAKENVQIKRVVAGKSLGSETGTEQLIHALQRDLALESGQLPGNTSLRFSCSDLPTYLNQPLKVRPIKRLVSRRFKAASMAQPC
jgi:hypothetical protein